MFRTTVGSGAAWPVGAEEDMVCGGHLQRWQQRVPAACQCRLVVQPLQHLGDMGRVNVSVGGSAAHHGVFADAPSQRRQGPATVGQDQP